mmetsp:Transcript_1019/g.3853  ORF Transcript_1019/g.3853 Transcript_1019/m.3853 type:complete len:140 (-) Transcript_1019:51-470(-)
MLPPVHARNDRSKWIAGCLASSALRLAPAPEPPGDKPPPGLDVEHAADVARVDSQILAHISEDRRGDTIADATAARPEGPAVDGELDRPRLATNPWHDGCCVQPLILCAEPPLYLPTPKASLASRDRTLLFDRNYGVGL